MKNKMLATKFSPVHSTVQQQLETVLSCASHRGTSSYECSRVYLHLISRSTRWILAYWFYNIQTKKGMSNITDQELAQLYQDNRSKMF